MFGWRLLMALILGATGGSCGSRTTGRGARGGSSGLTGALGSLGTIGSGPLDAVVGPRLMARLVEGEAVRRVAQAAERECCGVTLDPTTTPLTRQYFEPSSKAVCNDNSPAGFYFRRSRNSRRWIVFLEGGWYCFDRQSCEQRWHGLHPLMTSRGWSETRQVGGILSPDPEVNPYWWTANHVFVPYCSSDSWSGTRFSPEGSGGFSFMGSIIVEQVIESLVKLNLTHGHKLILAGSSAGGVGAMLNVDRVSQQLSDRGIQVEVRAISDSGWFLDNEPFAPLECRNAHSCPPVEAIRRGHELWQGRVPNSCLQEYPHHPWYCYLGYRLYPTMKSPLFVFQWVFDEAQMTADNVGKPISKEQWDYIHGIGERLRKTFENVTALFAPSCISHTVLTKKDWSNIKIGDVSLPQALYCWDIAPTAALINNKSHQKAVTSGLSTASGSQNKVRHKNRQRHRSSRRRDRGRERTKRRRKTNSGNRNLSNGTNTNWTELNNGRQVMNSEEILTDAVQSSHLILVHSDRDRKISGSGSGMSDDDAIPKYRERTIHHTNPVVNDSANSKESRANILDGEMLADSPRETDSISGSPQSYLESNAIENPQEELQKQIPREERPQRKGRDEGKKSRNNKRRKNRKRKDRGKDRKRKKKRRERRKKQRERRKKQKEKKKRRRSRLKGVRKTKEIPGDRERSARSVFLLHSKQSALQQTQPVSAATVSHSNTALLPNNPLDSTMSVISPTSTLPPILYPTAAAVDTLIQTDSIPLPSYSPDLVSTIVPSLTTYPGLQSIREEDDIASNPNEDWKSDMCPANSMHLTDHCAWPHCNYACPKLLNPFTGEEMNFIELLKSFGLDMTSVANALGIDIHTLNSMGNDELLLILTQ